MKVIDLIKKYHNDMVFPSEISKKLNLLKIKFRNREFTESTVKRIIQRFKNDLSSVVKKQPRVKRVKPY